MNTEAEAKDLVRPADRKFSWRKFGTIVACGAALFSDGYANNSMGTVNTILKKHLYPSVFKNSNRSETMSAIVFAGTVVGMLIFGYLSDTLGRKNGMGMPVPHTTTVFWGTSARPGRHVREGRSARKVARTGTHCDTVRLSWQQGG